MDEGKGCFRDSQNELRCKNNGIRGETARRARKRGVFEIHKTNYVVKTTELGRKPRGRCGNWVFSGIAKRITLLKQRNSRRNRAAGAVSKWKAVRAAARCQKSVRKTQIGRARRHYPHGGEVTRQVRKLGVFGIHKMNYVVKTTELERKPRGVRGVLIFRSTAEKMGLAAACWRAKSADGGGNRRTSAKKNTRGRCGQQMESCAGGGTLSKKCAKNANWTGAAALSPRRRGYAAKIMRRKNARRKFGKRASGESHYRNLCGIIRNIWYTAMRR